MTFTEKIVNEAFAEYKRREQNKQEITLEALMQLIFDEE